MKEGCLTGVGPHRLGRRERHAVQRLRVVAFAEVESQAVLLIARLGGAEARRRALVNRRQAQGDRGGGDRDVELIGRGCG